MTQLKDHIRRMLLEFMDEIEAAKWQGKERELVSHFAFFKLDQKCGLLPRIIRCCANCHRRAGHPSYGSLQNTCLQRI